MAPRPPRFMNSVHDTYPDDNDMKEVYLQAAGLAYAGYGDRHVAIWWYNGDGSVKDPVVTQVIQFTGQAGNYSYYAPVVLKAGSSILAVGYSHALAQNQQFLLSTYSRRDRDRILALADRVAFKKTSTTNGCRVWTRDLMAVMVASGLLDESVFESVVEGVPLPERRPE